MNQKTFSLIAGTIFLIIGILHVSRIIFSWEAVIGGWQVPMWLSWAAAAAAIYLGFQGVRYGR